MFVSNDLELSPPLGPLGFLRTLAHQIPRRLLTTASLAKTMQDPAACSYSGNQRPTHPQNLRRSRGSRQGALGIAPSSGLLALLATVAASSSTVEGIPLPFLCPSLDSSSPVARHIPRDDPLDVFIQPSPSPIKRRLRKRYVPVKFERADDGHWRRVETYSLYGSTMCLVSGALAASILQTC